MNVNFNDPIAWVALVSGLAFLVVLVVLTRKFVAYSRKRRNLKREIHTKKLLAEENNKTIEELFVKRRMQTLGLTSVASRKAKEIEREWEQVQELCSILFQKVSPKVADTAKYLQREERYDQTGILAFEEKADRFLWRTVVRPWMIFWKDTVPRIFSKPPRGKNKFLAELSGHLNTLLETQESVVAKLEGMITPIKEIDLTKDEFVDRMAKGRSQAERKKETKAKLASRLKTAKESLARAFKYLEVRQEPKSLAVGERPITAGVRCLKYEDVFEQCQTIKSKVEAMEKEGVNPNEIIDFISDVVPSIESGYETSAKKVARVEFALDELKDTISTLGESMGEIPKTPDSLNQAYSILEKDTSSLWASRDETALEDKLEVVFSLLDQAEGEISTLSYWARKIRSARELVLEIKQWENLLETEYKIVVERTKAFERHLSLFDEKVPKLWATADIEELGGLMSKIEASFSNHKIKIGDKLAEIGEIARWQTGSSQLTATEDFARKLAEIARVAEEPDGPNGQQPYSDLAPDKPELTGEWVNIVSPQNIPLRIDVSRLKKYLEDGYKVVEEEK